MLKNLRLPSSKLKIFKLKASKLYLAITLLALLLLSCAPKAEKERVEIKPLVSSTLSYYPHETGATWEYLAAGEPVDSQPLLSYVEGPTLVEGRRVIGWHSIGRGVDAHAYKEYRSEGVFTHQETRPGATITFTPPVQEFPPVKTLGLGRSWNGTVQANIFFPEALPADQNQTFILEYRYTVVDLRKIETKIGTLDVFIIDFESKSFDEDGNVVEKLEQEIWFTPYVGEIKNDSGLLLTKTNFPIPDVSFIK